MIDHWFGLVWLGLVLSASLATAASTLDSTSVALKEAKYTVGNPRSTKTDLIIQGSLDQNWVRMIVPAPTSVNILGKLGLLASSATDFKLQRPAKGEYKLLEHPDSFKASLHQVTHWGWKAFLEAHSSMDEIAQRTTQIPDILEDAIDVVIEKDAQAIKHFLPLLLDDVTDHIQDCKVRAAGTKKKFEDMSEIVAEILEGSLSTKAWSELQQSKLQLENNMQQAQKVDLDTRIKELKAQLKATKADVQTWRGKFEKAYDNMPTGWSMLGLKICESLTDFVGDILGVNESREEEDEHTKSSNGTAEPSKFEVCVVGNKGGAITKYNVTNREFSNNERLGLALLDGKLGEIFSTYRKSISSNERPQDLSVDTNIGENLNTFLDFITMRFSMKDIKNDIKTPVLQLIEMMRATAEEVSEHQKSGSHAGKADKYKEQIDKYLSSATCLESMAREIQNLPPVDPATPFDDDEVDAGLGDSPAERHMYLAHKRLAQSEARLTRLEEMYEKKLEKQAQLTASLQKVMNDITRITDEAKTNDAVLEVLKKALVLLGELGKTWKDLTRFFVAVEDRIRSSLAEKVKTFVERLEVYGEVEIQTKASGKLLFKSLVEASAEAALVNRIARKYVGISGNHIMPSVSKASMMITATDVGTRGRLSAELDNDISSANAAIEQLIRREKNGFIMAIQKRKKEVRETYEPILVNVPSKIKHEISIAVNTGVTATATFKRSAPSALENAAANVIATGQVTKKWSAGSDSSNTLDF